MAYKIADEFADMAEVVACADLVGRAGATEFSIGYLDDDPQNPRWWAHAQYRGARLAVDEQPTPQAAATRLAERILRGGRCRCGRRADTRYNPRRCLWRLTGARWEPGCDAKPIAIQDGHRGDIEAMHRAMDGRRG